MGISPTGGLDVGGEIEGCGDLRLPPPEHSRTSRKTLARLTRVLIRELTDSRTSGQIYLAVVQLVMIDGSETWVMTPHTGRVLGGFHHRVARRMPWTKPWRGGDGVWVYPPLEDSMLEVRLKDVETYVFHHQNIVAHFIATSPIVDLCLAA